MNASRRSASSIANSRCTAAHRKSPIRHLSRCAALPGSSTSAPKESLVQGIAAGVAAAFLMACPPSHAQLDMVPASQMMQAAQPLKAQEQPVDKNRIWVILSAGAVILFGVVLVLENNETYFPAIAKANKAMKITRTQEKVEEADYLREVEENQRMFQEQENMRQARMIEAELAQRRAAQNSGTVPQTLEQPSPTASSGAAPMAGPVGASPEGKGAEPT